MSLQVQSQDFREKVCGHLDSIRDQVKTQSKLSKNIDTHDWILSKMFLPPTKFAYYSKREALPLDWVTEKVIGVEEGEPIESTIRRIDAIYEGEGFNAFNLRKAKAKINELRDSILMDQRSLVSFAEGQGIKELDNILRILSEQRDAIEGSHFWATKNAFESLYFGCVLRVIFLPIFIGIFICINLFTQYRYEGVLDFYLNYKEILNDRSTMLDILNELSESIARIKAEKLEPIPGELEPGELRELAEPGAAIFAPGEEQPSAPVLSYFPPRQDKLIA